MGQHGWSHTPTLAALQELIDLSGAAPAAVARREGLSLSELHALRHLAQAPLGPAELARRLGVTTAASSGVVDRLVVHDHVVRRPHPGDGRRTEVVLTDHGRTEMLRMLAPMFAGLAAVDSSLDATERAAVDRYLRGAIAAVRAVL
jgi:DNA-binding MarR family transcriptional regulator